MTTYPSIDALYADRGGARSGECDFGVMWRSPGDVWGWRVSVVADTGDVYAVSHRDRRVVLLGTVPAGVPAGVIVSSAPAGGRDRPRAYDIADRVLHGWERRIAGPDGLMWIRDRLVIHGYAA